MSSEEDTTTAPTVGHIAGEYDTQEAVTEGLLSLLTPAVQEVDDRVRCVRQSQADLQHSIEVLNEDLKKISESHGIPADLNPYVKKLNNTRRRINIVNNILQNAQERLSKLHYNIQKETSRKSIAVDEKSYTSTTEETTKPTASPSTSE